MEVPTLTTILIDRSLSIRRTRFLQDSVPLSRGFGAVLFLPILYQNTVSVKASGPPFDNFYKKLYNKGKFVYTGVSDAGKG